MKKKAILLSLLLAILPFDSVLINAAQVPVELQIEFDDPTADQGKPQKGPVCVPKLSIEDYTLTFSTPCYGWTLTLVDENDNVAYTTIITSDSLVLPSTLSGDYQLRLIPNDGNIYFYGYVLF